VNIVRSQFHEEQHMEIHFVPKLKAIFVFEKKKLCFAPRLRMLRIWTKLCLFLGLHKCFYTKKKVMSSTEVKELHEKNTT